MSEQTSLPITVSVPIWGKVALDIGENSAYAAAARGDFPTIKVGGLLRVPVRPAARKLGWDDEIAMAELAAKLSTIISGPAKKPRHRKRAA